MYKFDDGIKNQVSNILNGSRKGITEAKTEYDQYLAANRARQQVQRVTGLNPTPEFLVAHMTGNPQHMEYLRQDLGTAMSQKDPTTLGRMESNLNDAHTFSSPASHHLAHPLFRHPTGCCPSIPAWPGSWLLVPMIRMMLTEPMPT
ncbi:MAG: hypothetical protein H7833_14455 [Magnetococcus sp. DMHC-1]